MSGHMMWFQTEFKNQYVLGYTDPSYIWGRGGVGVGTLMGYANPIIWLDLCFTLEMATFELVT